MNRTIFCICWLVAAVNAGSAEPNVGEVAENPEPLKWSSAPLDQITSGEMLYYNLQRYAKELSLSLDQKQQIEKLAKDYYASSKTLNLSGKVKESEDLRLAMHREQLQLLSPQQGVRFRQLVLQYKIPWMSKPLQNELELTAEQRARIEKIVQTKQESIAKLFPPGQEGFAAGADVSRLGKEIRDAVEKQRKEALARSVKQKQIEQAAEAQLMQILTPQQRTSLKELQGKVFVPTR